MKKYLMLSVAAIMLAACGGVPCSEHAKNARSPILFKHNSTEITPESQSKLDDGLIFLTGHRFRKIQLDGWSDQQGGDTEYNKDLSKKRAEKVRDYMVSHGVAEKRITTQWHGVDKGKPYAQHRRVEVTVSGD